MENNKNRPTKNDKSYIVYLKKVHDEKYYSNNSKDSNKNDQNSKPEQKEKKGLYFI